MTTLRSRSALRRLSLCTLTAILVVFGFPVSAGASADNPTPEEVISGLVSDLQSHGANARGFVDQHVPEAQARVAEIQRQARAGNWPEVRRLTEQLKTDAACVMTEFDLEYIPADNKSASIDIDLGAGVARAAITVPDGCTLPEPMPVTLVSWGLDAAQAWATSPQGQVDITDTVWVQEAGTYSFEVDLPRPTTDPAAIRSMLDRDGFGPMVAAAETGGLDLDGIIETITSNPQILDLVLGLICPFQVDMFKVEASTIPAQLGGLSEGQKVPDNPHLGIDGLIEGKVGEWDSAKQFSPIPDVAEGFPQLHFDESLDDSLEAAAAADPEIGGLLESIPFELLCAPEAPPTDVGGEQVTNVPASTSGSDTGVEVAGASEALPRTGSDTPGLLMTGLALMVAGWLALVGNAATRARNRGEARRSA